MSFPSNGEDKQKLLTNTTNSCSDLNELSSKSLLANVLDMKDDFGVIGSKLNNYQKGAVNRLKNSRTFNEQMGGNTNNYQTTFLKRENSTLSQCENCGDILFNSKSDTSVLRKCLNLILKELKVLTQKLKDDEEDENKELNWKFAAMVIDRLCMVIFTVATVVSTIGILLTSKNFFKFK